MQQKVKPVKSRRAPGRKPPRAGARHGADERLRSNPDAPGRKSGASARGKAALNEARQIADTVLKTVGARIFWKDRNLRYLGCNDLFAHDAGFAAPEQVIGKDDYQMVWREQADLYRADDRRVIDTGRAKLLIEEPQTTPEGKSIVLLTNKVPLRDQAGQIIGLLGTYMDITERKRLEETLLESEARFHSVAEVAQDGLVIIDAAGAITYWNPAAERIFGYSAAEANGRQIHDWLAPQRYRAAAAAGMAGFAKSGLGPVVGKTLQIEALRKDGVEIQVELSIAATRIGNNWSAIAIVRDVTERKRVDDAVRRSEEKYRDLVEATSDLVWIVLKKSPVATQEDE